MKICKTLNIPENFVKLYRVPLRVQLLVRSDFGPLFQNLDHVVSSRSIIIGSNEVACWPARLSGGMGSHRRVCPMKKRLPGWPAVNNGELSSRHL